jgi:hypothetical protein
MNVALVLHNRARAKGAYHLETILLLLILLIAITIRFAGLGSSVSLVVIFIFAFFGGAVIGIGKQKAQRKGWALHRSTAKT